ncbi:hypothetical protein H1C71_006687 [Ictidomys tridecemlineatus]|nr:hypothetical protein H1C71_006687 [Ictidomys tridecemlineatus]
MASAPGLTASQPICPWTNYLALNMMQGQTPADIATVIAPNSHDMGVSGQPAWRKTHRFCLKQYHPDSAVVHHQATSVASGGIADPQQHIEDLTPLSSSVIANEKYATSLLVLLLTQVSSV